MTPQAPRPSLTELEQGLIDERDLAALQQLANIHDALDPVPPGLIDRISFGITLNALHAEIAELQRSSELAGVRSSDVTQARTVTFTSTSLTTMVTVTPLSVDVARVDGWVAPGGGVSIEVRTPTGPITTTADADGRFVFEQIPRGLVQFLVRHPAPSVEPPVLTPSIEI